jgi:branched-chain amino acid transport system ATP-binding protein
VVRTFQHLRLWNRMTVLENVLLACPAAGENVVSVPAARQSADRGEAALERALRVGVLRPGGTCSRAAETSPPGAEAVIHGPHLRHRRRGAVAGQPTSGLDSESMVRIVPLVRRLVERGKTVLLIERNMG